MVLDGDISSALVDGTLVNDTLINGDVRTTLGSIVMLELHWGWCSGAASPHKRKAALPLHSPPTTQMPPPPSNRGAG